MDWEKLKKELEKSAYTISWVKKSESVREIVNMLLRAAGQGLPAELDESVVAWNLQFWKAVLPDIEIYLDKALFNTIVSLIRKGKPINDVTFREEFIARCNYIVLHELIHSVADSKDEILVSHWTEELMKAMLWTHIHCPIKRKMITWGECFECKDYEKHPTCPLRAVRIDAYPRQYEFGLYHVTELNYLRKSYFERVGKPYGKYWSEYYDFLYGKALGDYIQGKHPKHCQEITLKWKPDKKVPEDFKGITGHQDLHLEESGQIIELKFYAILRYMIRQGRPNPNHDFQARAYYTLGLKCKPWLYKGLRKITVIYYSKSKEAIRRKEFDIALEPVDILTPALKLHNALKTKTPPEKDCPDWLCKKYCPHKDCEYNQSNTKKVLKV